MTEKRFIIDSIGVFHDNHNALHDLEVVDLLNSFHEENEQLRTKNNAYLQDIEIFKEENTTLKLENEQLKSELKVLRKQYNYFSDMVDKRLKEMDMGLLK